MGYPVFYSDLSAREILENHPEAIQQVTALFGPEAYLDNRLNRTEIARQVFADTQKRNALNHITHPLVRAAFQSWHQTQKSRIVFNEAAILFETGAYKNFDYTLLVTAPESTRIKRVMLRDKTALQQVKERLDAQWPDEQKIPLASFTIFNDDVHALIPQIQQTLLKLNA